jgi:tRNA1(Val) A37 N6-methylase TrmN6
MILDSSLKQACTLVTLPDGSKIYQHKDGQRVSTDNELFNYFLVQRFSQSSKEVKKVLELGLGTGINGIMLKKSFPNWEISGLEIDHEQAQIAQYNCQSLGLDIKVITGDIKDYQANGKYDLILANPPYLKLGQGRLSPSHRRNLAKFELACRMSDVFTCVKRNMAEAGQAYLLYAKNREEDLLAQIVKNRLEMIEKINENKIIIIGLKHATDK